MARGGFWQRHKVAVASNAALVLAAAAVVTYAVAADGYRAHEAELNDGGIWVVHGDRGIYGRINKPINQLDTIIYADRGRTPLDVVQDGAAVVAIDERAGSAQVIDPVTSEYSQSGKISVPTSGDVQLAGGTFATLDAEAGTLWAVRVDPVRGQPLLAAADRQSEPLAKVGDGGALAVSRDGTVVATSAARGTVTYVDADGADLAKPRTEDLPGDAGDPTALTTVGERVVTLDQASGTLAVLGGARAEVAPGSVLQQPGPDADSVLVGSDGALVSVDLESGTVQVVEDGLNGVPVAPVRLGPCVYGAWSGGQGAVTLSCSGEEPRTNALGGKASRLAFRVNRGEIVLNDSSSGRVWDLDDQRPQKIDNWNAFTATKKVEDEEEQNQEQSNGDRRPPRAEPDSYGARAGRTTVLHPLDNDSAPDGRLLSIIEVDQPTGGARAEISPDGQTVVLQLPERARSTSFEYYIDDGRSSFSAHATVSVAVRGIGDNRPPAPREGFKPRTWRVPAGGSLSVPALADWRDDADGDSLMLDSAVAVGGEQSGAVARTTADGRVRFTASREGGEDVQVQYAVTDGRSEPVRRTMTFRVQGKLDRESFAATAEPDVVRGEVGQPIKIRPLLNDLPGSDPATPHAELALGGKVPGQAGASIKSDLESGTITFTGTKPGTYFLDYDAAYGNAPLAKSTVRVDVKTPRSNRDPVAMPDTLTVYGQAAGIVDVLANDLDPAGRLLVVQRATADERDQLDVAVIDGRWLRISARQGELSPNPALVHYTISNGTRSGIEGEVVVSQRPVPEDNSPVTAADRVYVRAGTSVTAPVLDNDVSPSGDRLTLVGDVAEGAPGELPIIPPVDVTGDLGRAFVSGRTVRYVAPAHLAERDSFQIPYVASNSSGDTSPGRLSVVIIPANAPNTAPEPPTLEGRAVSGEAIKVRLPGSGVDPDGDPVTVAGITSAPRYGRVLSFGGNFLEYQAYPRTVGTDEFEYSVVDTGGAVATGTVRVAVVPPDTPQPPLAVGDQLTVEPGRTAVFDPLANDHVAPDDDVRLRLVDPPAGVTLDPETSLVSVPAPATVDGDTVQVVYSISNGIDESRATMRLETAEGINNPPVVYDAYGQADDSESVSVDVLDGAYDPDGPADGLRVTRVYGDAGRASVDGSRVKADRGSAPLVVPFRVEDGDGGAATASLYVPPTGTAIPYVKPDALIQLAEGGSARGRLKDYVVNPSGGPLRLTGRNAVGASPTQLSPEPDGEQGFRISAADGYRGPGALLLEVTTALDEAGNEDPSDPADGYTALLSVPVQVGDDTPVLQCPETTIPISAGQRHDLDIASLCNVWTLDPRDAAGLDYEGTWTTEVPGLGVSGTGGPVLSVEADQSATDGGDAVLSVTAGGSNAEEIRFRLAAAPPPTMLPVEVSDLEAGTERRIDLAPYLEPGVARPEPTVVSVQAAGGSGVSASSSGSTITLRAAKDAEGRAVFRVVMSDIADSTPSAERRVERLIEVEVRGLPGKPGPPRPFDSEQSNKVSMGWDPPSTDGGSPITHYVVKEIHSGDPQRCRTNQCEYGGLKNGQKYAFRVAAVNKIGQGPWSDVSQTAYADTAPGRVSNIRMVRRGDHVITVAWDPPTTATSKVLDYTITWPGGSQVVSGNTKELTIAGLDNNQQYVVTVVARNRVNVSAPRQSAPFQSLGTPAPPGGLALTDLQSGVAQTAVRLSWVATAPEGPGPTLYTVSYSTRGGGQLTVPGCSQIQALTCTHAGIAYDGAIYGYSVRAHNIKNPSAPSAPVAFEAVGKPAAWGSWQAGPTGADQQIRVVATAPESRGTQSVATILVNGNKVWSNTVRAGGVINEVVPTPSNEGAYPVQLLMCNEHADAGGCTYSADTKTVQSYGPLGDQHLNQPVASVSGLDVTWTISGTSNGDAALVSIQVDDRAPEVVPLGGPGAFSLTRTISLLEYNTGTSLRVRLFDDAPAGRGEGVRIGRGETGDPPPPVVRIRPGTVCNDELPDATRCKVNQFIDPICKADMSCAKLFLHTTGFRKNFSCEVINGGNEQFFRGRTEYGFSGDEWRELDWYFGTGDVQVRCFTPDRKQVGIGQFNWP